MHHPTSVLENDTHKLLFYLISARRLDLIIINKKKENMQNLDFTVPADYTIKLEESEKKD